LFTVLLLIFLCRISHIVFTFLVFSTFCSAQAIDEQLADRNFIDPDIFPGLGVSGFRGLALAGVVGSAVSLFDVRILYFILVLQWGLGKGGWERLLPHKFLVRIALLYPCWHP